VQDYAGDDKENPKSMRYQFFGKHLMDRIEGLRAEIDPSEFDPLNIRENLKKIIDIENIRNRGFNTAMNSITSILDTSKMGYQYLENLKNAREMILREYEDTDASKLPDERYQIRMQYYDNAQLIEERKAYDAQVKSFEIEIHHLWDVLQMVYVDSKFMKGITDFKDLAKSKRNKIRKKIKAVTGDPLYEDIEKSWDEISFLKPGDTDVERMNRTYVFEKDHLKRMLILMRNKLQQMYGFRYPIQRRVTEDRLEFLETDFLRFDYMINPYHIQPGLLLDVDITSIKRKKATLDGMANVLNEFLHGVSKGFQDAAFATFSRRRSTMREDIAQSFSGSSQSADLMSTGVSEGSTYLDMLNQPEAASSPAPAAPEPAPARKAGKAAARRGAVDAPKKKRGARRGRRSQGGTLREI
jgi:hypothetical protein